MKDRPNYQYNDYNSLKDPTIKAKLRQNKEKNRTTINRPQ